MPSQDPLHDHFQQTSQQTGQPGPTQTVGVARKEHEENEKRLRRNRKAREATQRKKEAAEDVATNAAMAADPGYECRPCL